MKRLLCLVLALAAGVTAQAKCLNRGLEFWPQSGPIQAQAVFLIEGIGLSQAVVGGLRSTHQAFLQAGTQRIPLDVQETLVGQFQLTQALLRPRRRPAVGTQYELIVVERARPAENIVRQHQGFRAAAVQYTVTPGADQTAPAWRTPPVEKTKHYEVYGCGPALFVAFAGAVRDEASGRRTSSYLRPDAAGALLLGHGMCAGAFKLENGTRFSVAFGLLDAAGNATAWSGPALAFAPPQPPGL